MSVSQAKRTNVNVGILGHVDSGKTTLAKALSTVGSTAAFDSNPQSRERGITIDLGFSSFSLGDKWNFTLVDCPGHASLIKTVVGGVQIMDVMVLCIDVMKGLQAQGQECLTIAQLTCEHLIAVITKLDLIESSKREAKMLKTKAMVSSGLSKTKFAGSPVTFVSALDKSIGVEDLQKCLLEKVETTKFIRDNISPFLMAIDHCFVIKGQGTVLTGTILQGRIKLNDSIEVPAQKIIKKVKSIQSFKVPLTEAGGGDRVGLCVPGIDATKLERGVVSSPGFIHTGITAAVIALDIVSYYKTSIRSNQTYQLTIGYENVEARIFLFYGNSTWPVFDPATHYEFVASNQENSDSQIPYYKTSINEHTQLKKTTEDLINTPNSTPKKYFALLQFKTQIMIVPNQFVIGADWAGSSFGCRIAFYGNVVDFTDHLIPQLTYFPNLNIYRRKVKVGRLENRYDRSEDEVIVSGFCKKASSIQHLIGMQLSIIYVVGETYEPYTATIHRRFGQTTKLLVKLDSPIPADLKKSTNKVNVSLMYKKFLFHPKDNAKLAQ